jgi:hypothetical protein
MKKYILVVVILILVLLYFIARYLENTDSNHNRHRSNSIYEASQNNLLLGKYKLVNNSDSLFFTINEAWVEKAPLYIDDKFSKINNNSQNFILIINYKEGSKFNAENYTVDWMVDTDNAIAGSQGKYWSFFKSNFGDKIQLKIKLLKERYNFKNPDDKVYKTLEFEEIK